MKYSFYCFPGFDKKSKIYSFSYELKIRIVYKLVFHSR